MIEIKSKKIEPSRMTYSHVARRLGDKPASRYQEGTLDLQATDNFHYRPLWQPEFEIYDKNRTALKMEDWYKFMDPRQYYYGTYTINRGKQQDSAEQNFSFVEKKNLLAAMPVETSQKIKDSILPLRHFEWGANMNNSQICAMGYGATITAPAMFQAADRLGNAQYITRIGLLLSENDPEVLNRAKQDWTDKPQWQGLRKVVEDSFVVEDWFELFVAQNFVMDSIVHPLFFEQLEKELIANGGTPYAMLTDFITNWRKESIRWVDQQIKIAAKESETNKDLLTKWTRNWLSPTIEALAPLAEASLEDGSQTLGDLVADFQSRAAKVGITL